MVVMVGLLMLSSATASGTALLQIRTRGPELMLGGVLGENRQCSFLPELFAVSRSQVAGLGAGVSVPDGGFAVLQQVLQGAERHG